MANITINQELINNKGKKFTIVKVDEKAGTAILKAEDGESKIYSFSSLKDKRRFTPVETEVQEITTEDSEETIKEEVPEENLVPMPGAEGLANLKEEKSSKARITITFNGETKTPSEWAIEFNLSAKYIRLQLRKGKSPEDIFGGR